MDIIVGSVVKAKAGKDKNNFFVVTDILDEGYVLICDGKTHKLDKPKKKNIKHLQLTKTVLEIASDRKLRQDLLAFKTEDN